MIAKPVKVDIKAMALLVILCASWGLQQISIKIAVQSIAPALQDGEPGLGGDGVGAGHHAAGAGCGSDRGFGGRLGLGAAEQAGQDTREGSNGGGTTHD